MDKTSAELRQEANEMRLQRLERKVAFGHNITAAAVGFTIGMGLVALKNQRKLAGNQVLLAQNQLGLSSLMNRLAPVNH